METQENHGHKDGEHGHSHENVFHIIVNLEPKEVRQEKMTFDEVCRLAFPQGPFGENIRYTITYTHRGEDHPMLKGDSVELKNGMIFHVGNTDRS